ncbi:biotin-independent malonate decarboxylase subunit gamma [Dyella caseinilytica]|uniref:Biotin-independent malonate decarboxylase subunit gamma n=1 Tax=Dyella caseinilytica TaxID=1849581 RepID=A0ABX7GSE1_9GAMM|nr:biotin-independent malonate decarboxylase subunit gamma [Dyella caseinilytica]QRN53351.1 biotin-independent malonate decarboxylase subunit gamma [Dyella caseinilytica]GFZ85827.1 biotin-independent malonate decarboxylase subunit gamma [Dyella caseinilytica]
MTLDNILASLFPRGHDVILERGLISGRGPLPDGGSMAVIGVDGRAPVGVEEATLLSSHVLDVIKSGGNEPILVLIDSDSQRMSKRDELLGLNEFLAHLAKCLILADKLGHRTIGLLYGHTAAGAFIATALATQTLLALPGAEPAVMDLPSMSRVTKLSIEVLQEKAKSTPVFAPGLDNLAQTGAVAITLNPDSSLADQLKSVLSQPAEREDSRDKLGKERKGRPKAADIAERVYELARASV